jgi:integrase/recombinase XerD
MRLNEEEIGTFIDAMQKRGWSDHTIRAYERGVRFFVTWLDDQQITIDEATAETIVGWRNEIARWNVAPSTRELRFAAVKTFFRLLNEIGVIENDVADGIDLPKRNDDHFDERPVLDQNETAEAIENIDPSSPLALRDRAIIEVLVVTGIRNSELRALTLGDVDFEDGTLLIRRGKGRKMRIVPLGRAAGVLAQYIAHARPRFVRRTSTDALFLSREHGPLSREGLVRIVRARVGVAPHRLRHSSATQMLHRGAQQAKIQAVLGHTSFETTRIYLH